MSPQLQAILNNVGTTTQGVIGPPINVSSGKLLDDKLVVLTYLLCNCSGAQYLALFPTSVAAALPKIQALQGVNEANMLDLMITGLAFRAGAQNTTWSTLLTTSKAALDGQAGLSPYDYTTLINFVLLYWVAGVLVP